MPPPAKHPGLAMVSLGALGVVFGDLGTSPLYTMKTVLDLAGGSPGPATALGLLSLLVWTLLIITSLKYVAFVMRVDNDGEGGILALMSLLGVKNRHRPVIIGIGLFGAALIYGDGIITPAISVLSALEGLDIVTPAFTPYVLPVAVAILILLFAVQPLGTAQIGRLFGPVMLLWFVVIGALGIWGVAQHPGVLVALNPLYGVGFLVHGGWAAFLVLGGVFLCVTGAEALYADMGHFGARPIRLAWYCLVLPALLLNYAGQTALVLDGSVTSDNIFYRLCPPGLLMPMVILATLATIIASQSIITGAFSMTRQAIQLGWFPRLHITQTSREGYGQIYVGAVNWIMMALTIVLTVGFGKSDNLAAAYGIAVSLTMLLTTALLYVAMREVWHWGLARSLVIAGLFFCVDAGFFIANLLKVLQGGWVPLLLAGLVFGVMAVWHRGSLRVVERLRSTVMSIEDFLADVAAKGIARVPGSAVFLTRARETAPPVMIWHVRNNRALHKRLIALTVTTESIPYVDDADRMTVERITPDFSRVAARFGFMERPDVMHLLRQAHIAGCPLDPDDLTFYVGHETVRHRTDGRGMPVWQELLFAFLLRNSAHVTDFFGLPSEGVVEIGRQVDI